MPQSPFLSTDPNAATPRTAGLLTPGNIDMHRRPVVKNADGSISTVRSIGVNVGGKEVLIPTVSDDGQILSNTAAINLYRRTGKHLGIFDTPAHSSAFAQSLHNDQAAEYGTGGSSPFLSTDPSAAQVSPTTAPGSSDWSARLGLHTPTASPALGFFRGAGTAAVDMAEGAVSGAASTVYQGGDLIRRGLGMPRVIERPDVQQAMRAPETVAGTIGRGVEQAAEFGVPLSKVSKATAASSLLTRAVAEGAASVGVAGVQTGGDPGAMTLSGAGGVVLPFAGAGVNAVARGVRRAAAGAQEGGLGGAVASAVRTVAPGEPRVMLTQALKPRNAAVNWGGSVDRALPDLKAAEAVIGKPVESLDDLLATVKTAKAANRAEYDAVAGPLRAQGATVDLTPVADNIVKGIPRKLQVTNPARAKAIAKATKVYRKRFSLQDAETLLQDTNAELEAYYAQFPQAQRAALRAKPEVAQMVAEADALRTAIYTTLDAAAPNASARAVQRRYGALLDIEQEAMRRANVAARQQPESLSEQIGAVRAAADMARGGWRLAHGDLSGAADIAAAHAGRATAKAIKESQTTDALIKRAFAGYSRPSTAAAAAAQGARR